MPFVAATCCLSFSHSSFLCCIVQVHEANLADEKAVQQFESGANSAISHAHCGIEMQPPRQQHMSENNPRYDDSRAVAAPGHVSIHLPSEYHSSPHSPSQTYARRDDSQLAFHRTSLAASPHHHHSSSSNIISPMPPLHHSNGGAYPIVYPSSPNSPSYGPRKIERGFSIQYHEGAPRQPRGNSQRNINSNQQ